MNEQDDVSATTDPVDETGDHTTFSRAVGRRKGYDPEAVDAFLEKAHRAFDEEDEGILTSSDIRSASFPLVKGGYLIPDVDASLGRIEDAFAAREREVALATRGARAWVAEQRGYAQEILDRLLRPRRRRFDRVSLWRYGYRVDEVDVVADRIAAYLATGEPLTVEQVRAVAFRMQRRGYREAQVDAVLDAVVGIMRAVG